jgi:glutathione S-transferase
MLTFYHSKGNSCAIATQIALEEAGATYKSVVLDFSKNEQRSEDFLNINRKGRVPVLITPQGTLTENVALLLYVAQIYPAAKLAPTDPFELAKMQAFNAYLSSTVHVAHAHRMRGYRWTDDAAAIETMKAKVPQNMTDCAGVIEKEYLEGPWVLGKSFSVADCYLYIIASWMPDDGVDLTKFPKISAHLAAMNKRVAVQRVMASYA